jgi:hypothetical protein
MVELLKINLRTEHTVYKNAAGRRVPGVTTILGELAKPHLMPWYASTERDGILRLMGRDTWTARALIEKLPVRDNGKPLWFAEAARDSAADLGTISHARIHARLRRTELDPEGLPPDLYGKSDAPVSRFFGWFAGHDMVETEHVMVSERWQIGGTTDVLAYGPTGELELWDIKTGKPWHKGTPYKEHIAQVAAYAAMYEETAGRKVSNIRIARIGKTEGDSGDLYEVPWATRNAGVQLFEAALAAYMAKRLME